MVNTWPVHNLTSASTNGVTTSLEHLPTGVVVCTLNVQTPRAAGLAKLIDSSLSSTLESIASAPNVKAVVLTSPQTGTFLGLHRTSGVDFVETAALAEEQCRRGQELTAFLTEFKKPIVAAIPHSALGNAFEVALACHGRVLGEHPASVLGLTDIQLGLTPSMAGLQRLSQLIGVEQTLEYALSGRFLRPDRARALGVLHLVVPPTVLLDKAAGLALELAQKRSSFLPTRLLKNTLLSSVFQQAQAQAKTINHLGSAPQKVVSILETLHKSGWKASLHQEASAIKHLRVSQLTKALAYAAELQTHLPIQSPAPASFIERVQIRYLVEVERLKHDGTSESEVDQALAEWGFSKKPSTLLESMGISRFAQSAQQLTQTFGPRFALPKPTDERITPPVRVRPTLGRNSGEPVEEIQMRCVFALVNEALLCLEEGVLQSKTVGDMAVNRELGFPAFRGGPFYYIHSLGQAEALRRIATYQARRGPIWTPARWFIQDSN
ncbi:MAG: enoyl-CoA hydratase/isomerase family protein [Polyangiaceae bacterium]|nr:enoyl-CoA hydratase/isomerase family protein [Polyangiaceae bacterium]